MKNSIIDTFATATTLLAILTLTSLTLLITGCGEGKGMNMVDDVVKPTTQPTEHPKKPTTTGDMKQPEEPSTPKNAESEEPTPPADTTPPTVVEVAWYSDWQMTKPLAIDGIVRLGDTVYTTVAFSEPVTHVISDDETARPALSIVTDGTAVQYKMLPHGVSFRSGEAKPIGDSTDKYLCKYTLPAGTVGMIALQVGATTADLTGNTVAEVSRHAAPFMYYLPKPTEPEELVIEPPKEQTPRERAEEIVSRIMKLHLEAPDHNTLLWKAEVFEQETGLSYWRLIKGTLYTIYLEERPEDKDLPFSWYDIAIEYLRLGFLYPNAGEQELLDRFRQSVRDGLVQIDLEKSEFIKKRREKYKDNTPRRRELMEETAAIRNRIFKRVVTAIQKKKEDDTFDLVAARDTIFREEAGLSFDFVHNTLLKIYLEENPEHHNWFFGNLYSDYAPLIHRYLYLTKMFEEETEEAILTRFRIDAREGVVIRPITP